MPRQARYIIPGIPLHVVQRGVDRQQCFRGESDFIRYWRLLNEHGGKSTCSIHAYVLMTNHVHLLLTPPTGNALTALMKPLGQEYAQYFNSRHRRTGPLWESRYRVHIVQDDEHLLACQRYIELNPVRAGICGHPGAYQWSSYGRNAMGQSDDVVTPHALYLALHRDPETRLMQYRHLFDTPLAAHQIDAIRAATASQAVFGSNAFAAEFGRNGGAR